MFYVCIIYFMVSIFAICYFTYLHCIYYLYVIVYIIYLLYSYCLHESRAFMFLFIGPKRIDSCRIV